MGDVPDFTFQCPKCRGSSFGSECFMDPKVPMHRYCHGRMGPQNCKFNWLESDDWMYFLVDGKKVTETEYAEAVVRMRSIPVYGLGTEDPESPKK